MLREKRRSIDIIVNLTHFEHNGLYGREPGLIVHGAQD